MGKKANETSEERKKRLEYNRQWHANHREEENKKRKKRYHEYQQGVQCSEYRIKRLEILARMGAKCVFCNRTDESSLVIDHVQNDGAKERKLSKSILSKLGKMASIPTERYQVLCAICNHKKRILGSDPTKWPPERTVGEMLEHIRSTIKTMEEARKEIRNGSSPEAGIDQRPETRIPESRLVNYGDRGGQQEDSGEDSDASDGLQLSRTE